MNGNRGAKGSIKDRLISMLYRLRYKEKVLKEENYTVLNKEKQVKYLNNLKEFGEKEDTNILDNLDRKRLSKVNIDAKFKIHSNKEFAVNRKAGIELKLDSLDYKSSELNSQVDIKKEIKKTKQEVTILKEVNSFIKNSLENIEDIKKDIYILKKESKIKNKDTKETEEKYKELKKKVEKLKQQYDAVKEKYDLSEFSILGSIKLISSIEDYTSLASLNEMDMILNICKKEIEKISSVTIINVEKKKIGSNIEEVKKDQKNVKIKFNKSKETIKKIHGIEENIQYELNKQKEIVDEMYSKASYLEKSIKKEVEVIGHRKIISSLFRLAGGIVTLPLTGFSIFGIALGSTMINKGLKEMNQKLETREKMVFDYKYEDISKQISDVKDKVQYTNLIISDSLDEIKKLKENFKKVYGGYNNIIPEYKETLNEVNELESKLIEQQNKLLNIDKKLEEERELNKQKMMKIK